MRAWYSPHYVVRSGSERFPTEKFALTARLLAAEGVLGPAGLVEPDLPPADELLRAHTPDWVGKAVSGGLTAGEEEALGLAWSPALSAAHRLCVRGTLEACRDALRGGLGLHVGGGSHHAFAGHGEGFCLLNDLAVALLVLQGERAVARAAVVDLDVHQGNGTASILAGREGYEVTAGEVLYEGKDLLSMPPEERARAGIFLAFQYPVEIPGVNTTYFLKAALNAVRKHRGLAELDAMDFLALVKEKMKVVEMEQSLLNRAINEGFSGGEKKRNEVFQMALLDPKLAILDETDSGLDIDALRVVAGGVNALRGKERAMIVITHYQRLLNYIVPDYVHVLSEGRIVKSGDKGLALELEERGYVWLEA